jgi:AcrR family transcriptional regulator
MEEEPERAGPRKLPPGRHGLPRQFVLHNQRGRLVEAAMHVFGTRSFGEARVADVLERAAISRKTFYEQFADKEACFMAAYEAASVRVRDAVRAASRDQTNWDDSVRAGIEALLQFLASEPELARLLVVEVTGAGPSALRRRADAVRSFAAMLAQTSDEDAPLGAQVAAGGIWEVVHAWVLEGRADELPDLADALVECAKAQIEPNDKGAARAVPA